MLAYQQDKLDKMKNEIDSCLVKARIYVKEGEYSPAITNIEIAEFNAEQLKINISKNLNGLKTSAYQLAVDANVEKAHRAFDAGNILCADAAVDLAIMYADSGKIAVPEDMKLFRARIKGIEKAMPPADEDDAGLCSLLASLPDEVPKREPAGNGTYGNN